MTASRPTVLLTGSTGVIGASLLPSLAMHHDVTALVHRRRPQGATACVQGDLTANGLGLSTRERRELAAGIDIVVHCAGLTTFAPDLTLFDDVNAEGTRQILELAEQADVPVVLISSNAAVAAVDTPGDDLSARTIRAYGRSKQRSEHLAAQCRQPVAIVRPALLFAARDAVSMPQQFPHVLLTALLQGQPGRLPLHPDQWADILPMETLVSYLTALTQAMLRGDASACGLHWTTAGPARVTAADLERACLDFLREEGRPAPGPLLAAPTAQPRRTHGLARVAQLGFATADQPPLPTDLTRYLPTQPTRSDVLDALAHNVRRCAPWAVADAPGH
ncbi:SDR family oxidoreductase [Streptomyces sp. NPDC091204]|uniref:SDR family oxidoreductase n=1 Tax=Streptomyces sp. NPDC091204 TaxID=3155299 RepID=UPI0034311744